jgi:hypothetical protein
MELDSTEKIISSVEVGLGIVSGRAEAGGLAGALWRFSLEDQPNK